MAHSMRRDARELKRTAHGIPFSTDAFRARGLHLLADNDEREPRDRTGGALACSAHLPSTKAIRRYKLVDGRSVVYCLVTGSAVAHLPLTVAAFATPRGRAEIVRCLRRIRQDMGAELASVGAL